MKIIMSPAKKMRSDEDASITPTTPCFLNESYRQYEMTRRKQKK